MSIVKSTYFKVFLSMPRSMTSSRAGPDATADRGAIMTTCPISTIRMRRLPPFAGSIEGAGMVSRTSPTSSGSRELRLPVETGIQNVRYIFERFGAKIVNNNQFLGLIF